MLRELADQARPHRDLESARRFEDASHLAEHRARLPRRAVPEDEVPAPTAIDDRRRTKASERYRRST